ncbi:phosphodiester glycosidase family protein, partial [bacterium]
SYTADKGLTLSTPASGYAISKRPATFVVLSVGPKVLTPHCTIDGTVVRTVENVERLRVSPGQMVLSTQAVRESLRGATPGQKIRLRVDVKGFDWKRIDNVMGGGPPLLAKGVDVAPSKDSFATTRHPRTAVGRDAKGGTWLVVIDGRQVQSVGASLPETAEIMRKLGCVDAINLDGGGSSTLSLFGTTLNHLAGGIERGVANFVLFHGPSPAAKGGSLTIQTAPVKVGGDARMTVLENGERIDDRRIVWTAQGAAWIDGDGILHATKAGDVIIRALVDGRTVEAKLAVSL